MSKNENRANYSLTAFSNFITASSAIGGISLIAGVIFLHSGSIVNPQLWLIGAGLSYLGATGIALACAGWFLRQTARAIVEGMGGTIKELGSASPLPMVATSKTSTRYGSAWDESNQPSMGSLTFGQYDAWIAAGKPDTSTWDGEAASFDDWLSNRAGN